MKNPVFLSLDVDTWDKAHELASLLKNDIGGIKVGPRLAMKASPKDWQRLTDAVPVFYDPKYYDIPNTMVESLKACADMGFSYVTIHASSGLRAMMDVKKFEDQISKNQKFKILAVTALTSFGENNPIPGYSNLSLKEVVTNLAQITLMSGLSGLVCSGEEVKDVMSLDKNLFSVVPGIRLPEDAADDQSRVMTPDKAISLGAKALVVGRPILNAKDPLAAAKRFAELSSL